MGLLTMDRRCLDCDVSDTHVAEWTADSWDLRWDCPGCGNPSLRRVPSPMTTKRVTYAEGNNRFAAIKQAAAIEREAMDLPKEQRGEMLRAAREIKKI